MTMPMPAIKAFADCLASSVPMVESEMRLIKRLPRTELTTSEITMLVNKRNAVDFFLMNKPMLAQKVNDGSKKVIATLVSMVRPLCTPPPVTLKVTNTKAMAIASTAEASVSGVGFKFIKTRLIDEFAH